MPLGKMSPISKRIWDQHVLQQIPTQYKKCFAEAYVLYNRLASWHCKISRWFLIDSDLAAFLSRMPKLKDKGIIDFKRYFRNVSQNETVNIWFTHTAKLKRNFNFPDLAPSKCMQWRIQGKIRAKMGKRVSVLFGVQQDVESLEWSAMGFSC